MPAGAQPLSTARVIAVGHLTVTLPIFLFVGALAAAGALVWGPPGALDGALVGSCVLGWPLWAWTVGRWRRSFADRAASPQDVQRLAVATALIGPPGSVFEQAETSARVPLVWGMVAISIALFGGFSVLVAKGSAVIALGLVAGGCVCIAAAIAFDLRRSDSVLARVGIAAGIVAAGAWTLLPWVHIQRWAAAATVSFTTVVAFLLIVLLVWLPGEVAARRRWTAAGVVAILAVSLGVAYVSAASLNRAETNIQATSALAIASPKLTATWASFTTGADRQHVTMADGVQITDIVTGTGTSARAGDLLTVRYILWLSDGRQVDSSDAQGSPLKFTLGNGTLIQGWEVGVSGMAAGGTRRLEIPPELAYGDRGAANQSGVYVIPPKATLVFIIQLIAIERVTQ